MCLQGFTQHEALDFMFDVVKEAACHDRNLRFPVSEKVP